mgnify:CR=1 FL=1
MEMSAQSSIFVSLTVAEVEEILKNYVLDKIGDKKIGDTVTLRFYRNRVLKTVQIKLKASNAERGDEESL